MSLWVVYLPHLSKTPHHCWLSTTRAKLHHPIRPSERRLYKTPINSIQLLREGNPRFIPAQFFACKDGKDSFGTSQTLTFLPTYYALPASVRSISFPGLTTRRDYRRKGWYIWQRTNDPCKFAACWIYWVFCFFGTPPGLDYICTIQWFDPWVAKGENEETCTLWRNHQISSWQFKFCCV